LSAIQKLLEFIPQRLNKNGRFAVISFHSLEDRLVKEAFKNLESPCTCPREFPVCICGKKPLGKMITGKPITADLDEIKENKRSKSAKLRVFERNEEAWTPLR
jgi:16S rRNA (cytosine1402-N4)-methyltransferase